MRGVWTNCRRSIRQLLCAHPHSRTYYAKEVQAFGTDLQDGKVHAIGLRACLKCGAIRLDSVTASKADPA